MSAAYIINALSDKVVEDLNDVKVAKYDLQELEGDMGLNTLTGDLMVPVFFQFCVNHNFGTDNELELKMAVQSFVENYVHIILLDRLIPDYDPEEDLL